MDLPGSLAELAPRDPFLPAAVSGVEGARCSATGQAREDCEVWSFATEEPLVALEAAGTTVVAATMEAVAGVDAVTGQLDWVWEVDGGSISQVTLTDEAVFVLDQGGHRTVALDAALGDVRWTSELGEQRQAVQVANNEAVGTRDVTTLTVRDASVGEVLWSVSDLAPAGDAPPLIIGDVLLDTAEDQAQAYDLATGAQLWSTDALVPPAVAEGVVVTHDGADLAALEPDSGRPVWSRSMPDVRQLFGLEGDRVAVQRRGYVDLVTATTGEHLDEMLRGTRVDQLRPAGPNVAVAVAGANVQWWDLEGMGPTWGLTASRARNPAITIATGAHGQPLVVAPLNDGTRLVAARVRDREEPTVSTSCEGARPSRAFGDELGWRGDRIHLRFSEQDRHAGELAVGLIDANPNVDLTVTGHLQGRPDVRAEFSRFNDDWQPELTLDSGIRFATDWPSHWVMEARFSRPGCWQMHVKHGQVSDTIVLPVTSTE